MKCANCGRKDAGLELRYAKEFLCDNCFIDLFEKRVSRNIRANKLLNPKDKTAVALSGGKDSATALYLLNKLRGKAPHSKLIALTIDQGIKQQRKSLDAAKTLCRKLGVDHYIYSFREEFNITLDEIVEKSKMLENPAPACSYCGVFRRRLLNDKARELGVTKLATGHNLDDEVQTSLMNFFRGDLDRIARMGAIVGVVRDKNFIPRIKPLRECLENEVRIYAGLRDIVLETSRCPYSGEAFRGTVRESLDKIEGKHPGSKFQLLKSTDQLIPILRSNMEVRKISRCINCGDLTSGKICKVCQIKKELGLN